MKVSELKEMLKNVPDNHEVMVTANVSNFAVSVQTMYTTEITQLKDTGKTFLGMPVVGGDPIPTLILTAF